MAWAANQIKLLKLPIPTPQELGGRNAFSRARQPVDPQKYLLVPMDSRCTASPSGAEDYVYYAEGGWSWSVPYIAGLYALSCQVNPSITPEQFWTTAVKTGETVTIEKEGKKFPLGSIANPTALMEAIKIR